MKNNFFKKWMMPLGIAILGIAGAFTTMSMGSNAALADQQGYRFVSSTDQCHIAKMCATNGSVTCKYSLNVTAWGKENEELDQPCTIQLYEKP
jgi:hypothetical protein